MFDDALLGEANRESRRVTEEAEAD